MPVSIMGKPLVPLKSKNKQSKSRPADTERPGITELN